jgi:hypothetical protein
MDAIELLLSKNAQEREDLTQFLVTGNAKDFAHYQNICGIIRGLNLADVHLKDLADRMEKSDE